MARLAIYSHAISNTVSAMTPILLGLVESTDRVTQLRTTRSAFRGREGDLIFNYGSSAIPSAVIGRSRVINSPNSVSNASSKVSAFQLMTTAGVSTVEYTTDRAEAAAWVAHNEVVYARTQTRGHSGAGIVVCYHDTAELGVVGGISTSEEIVQAPLYTKGITGPRREFRIHVMNGNIVFTQQKLRRDGFSGMEEASNIVRNYHTGWIYATQNIQANEEARRNAIAAVTALSLDYGAVDVITNGSNAWVLEVNTAPGMTGSNLENFCQCLVDSFYGRTFAEEVGQTPEEETVMPVEEVAAIAPTTQEAVETPPEVVSEPHNWVVGDRFRVTNYDQSHRTRAAVITNGHEDALRDQTIMTVSHISQNGRISSNNKWFDKEWIQFVQPTQPTQNFELGDLVRVTNINRRRYEGTIGIHTDMIAFMNSSTTLEVTRGLSGGTLRVGDYTYYPESLTLVSKAVPVVHPVGLRTGDIVNVVNLVAPMQPTLRRPVHSTHNYEVNSVDVADGSVTLVGLGGSFLPGMLKVVRYGLVVGDFVKVIGREDRPGFGGVSFTPIHENLQDTGIEAQVLTTTTSGMVTINGNLRCSPYWLQRVRAAEQPVRSLPVLRNGDLVVVSNFDMFLTDSNRNYPSINESMRLNLRNNSVLTISRTSTSQIDSVRLSDGFVYNPHWLVLASQELVDQQRERESQAAAEAAAAAAAEKAERDAAEASANEVVVEIPPNNSVCKISLKSGGAETVGLYSEPRQSFDVVGFEMPVQIGEVSNCLVIGNI